MKIIESPVVKNVTCDKLLDIDVKKIIDNYKTNFNIDVSNYFNSEKIEIYQCPKTKYKFYYPKNLEAKGKFYEELNSFSKGEYYPKKWEHYQAFKQIKTTDSILEIGCGDGNFFDVCLENGITDLTGIEINKDCIEKLLKKNVKAFNGTIHDYALGSTAAKHDVVCAFQVLEHIYDVKEFIEACMLHLKKDGLLILAVPNNNPFFFKQDIYHTLNLPPHHVGLWNKESLSNLELFFNIKLKSIHIEPIKFYKDWYMVQKKYLKQKSKIFNLLDIVPRFIYKQIIRIFSPIIEGQYIIATYKKK